MKAGEFIKLNFKFEISNFCATVKVKITSLRTAVLQLANISSTTVIPLTYAIKQPLGTNNLTPHVNMCQSEYVYVLMGDSNKFQILICKRHNDNKG
jgi:hypothetical protein